MRTSIGSGLLFLLLGTIVGLSVATREHRAPQGRSTHSAQVSRELRVTVPGSSASILFGFSTEGGPAMWMSNGREGGSLQLGVHGNGFPFVLVSDAAIRNFGLGRVDGKNASPILVFRSEDVVRLVFGLSMTEPRQPAFLVHYTGDGRKHDFLGSYCDDPSRACIR